MPPGQAQGGQCVFCQLIANPSQLKLVGETENFYAWLDINPRAKGYTMVVPKEHIESIEEFSASQFQEGMMLARKVVDKAKEGLDADGVSITLNINEAAGQMVPHAYIQVFPRFEDEETAGTPTGAVFQPHEEAKKNLDSIKEKMASVDSSFGETTKEPHPDSQNFKGAESSGQEESGGETQSESEGEPIDQLADQLEESGSPLSLGGMSGGSKKSSGSASSSQKSSAQSRKSETRKSKKKEEKEEEKDEVRLDEDFEAKSFDWH